MTQIPRKFFLRTYLDKSPLRKAVDQEENAKRKKSLADPEKNFSVLLCSANGVDLPLKQSEVKPALLQQVAIRETMDF
jgi:hypothetical protein